MRQGRWRLPGRRRPGRGRLHQHGATSPTFCLTFELALWLTFCSRFEQSNANHGDLGSEALKPGPSQVRFRPPAFRSHLAHVLLHFWPLLTHHKLPLLLTLCLGHVEGWLGGRDSLGLAREPRRGLSVAALPAFVKTHRGMLQAAAAAVCRSAGTAVPERHPQAHPFQVRLQQRYRRCDHRRQSAAGRYYLGDEPAA